MKGISKDFVIRPFGMSRTATNNVDQDGFRQSSHGRMKSIFLFFFGVSMFGGNDFIRRTTTEAFSYALYKHGQSITEEIIQNSLNPNLKA